MLTGHKVLRLQLLTSTGRKPHAEVRQSFIPGPWHTHLFRTVLGGKLSNRVKILGSKGCPEKLRLCRECLPVFSAAFYPDLVETLFLPIGEQADTVGA